MTAMLGSVIAAIMLSLICKIYFEMMVPRREWRSTWFGGTMIPVFTLVFLLVAYSEIPPYAIQPIRFTILIFLTAQIYFQVKWNQNAVLSLFLCSIIWIADSLVLAVIYVLPPSCWFLAGQKDELVYGLLLAPALWYRLLHKGEGNAGKGNAGEGNAGKGNAGKGNAGIGTGWLRFGYFPVFSLAVIVAMDLVMWSGTGDSVDRRLRLMVVAGVGLLQILAVCYMNRILEQEREVQDMKLLQEQTRSQMQLYRTVQKNRERQQSLLHDYKNQMGCMKGLLEQGQTEEALAYISKLAGDLQKTADHVDTHHAVVNAVLNQKYQEALEQKIAVTMVLGELSALTLSEQDLVTLLANLLDNAIEACKSLEDHRVIHLKMTVEEEQMILSVKNPVKVPVKIEGKTVATTKGDSSQHGIGLRNVDAVIRKNHGTSSLRCENGWFSFSAMLPLTPDPDTPVS